MAEAELARFIDRFTVEFVRVFPHPIERVWRALTDPAELAHWCMPAEIDLRVGGAYVFQGEKWGNILALDPPRLIRFGKKEIGDPSASADNWMQYELEPTAQGTRMRFIEHWQPGPDYRSWFVRKFGPDADDLPGGPDSPFHPGTVGGWHGMFDDLADFLDGAPRGSRLPPSRLSAVAKAWADEKVRKGKFPAADADGYVGELRAEESYFDLIDIYREHIRAMLPPAGGGKR
jgi:uncharacterized protein YndB with AHSA1/START domain